MASKPKRRPGIFGPEPWANVADQTWSHFDRWFALVIDTDYRNDPDELRRHLETELATSLTGRDEIIAKLSHLADLCNRLNRGSIDTTTLSAAEAADRATLAKARRKVLTQALEGRAMTEAMHDTPAARLAWRAKYGHWDQFPSHPKPFHDRLAGKRTNHVAKGGSFRVVDTHRQRLRRLDGPRRSLPDRLALYRAFHTIGVELAERVNDSYGVVGELREEAYHTYLSLDWPATGMDRAGYWRDLCELLVVEVYGLTYKNETAAFANAVHDDVDVIETILLGLEADYRSAYQDYQADEALQLIAWCHIANGGHDRYVDAARRIGTDHWIPIDALARSALGVGRRDLAIEVFRAADRPGRQQAHLHRLCRQLTGTDLTTITPRTD